mgnify:FL=1
MKNQKKKSGIISILLILSLCFTGCDTVGKEIVWKNREAESAGLDEQVPSVENITEMCTEAESGADSVSFGRPEEVQTEQSMALYADICGAVQEPGVYKLEEGARIFQLIGQAGGLREDADLTSVNQAEKVTDGMKVRIYTKEEAASLPQQIWESTAESEQTAPVSAKININSADIAQLTQLTGIGEARAADIIAYRTEHGRFLTIEEIMNVSGIKESTFQKIKDQIVVE